MDENATTTELRDGDIYRWRWKDEEARGGRGAWAAYHCYSGIAEVSDGRLFDTYWSHGDRKQLKPADVLLEYQGNANEMSIITRWQKPYFRDEDVVDTRHRNHSSAPIYLKAGAKRDKDTMLELVRQRVEYFEREIKNAKQVIEELAAAEDLIRSGRLNDVHINLPPA